MLKIIGSKRFYKIENCTISVENLFFQQSYKMGTIYSYNLEELTFIHTFR